MKKQNKKTKNTKKFILKGKIIFEAKDIDEAFAKIAKHFALLASGNKEDEEDFLPGTDITIKPLKEKT